MNRNPPPRNVDRIIAVAALVAALLALGVGGGALYRTRDNAKTNTAVTTTTVGATASTAKKGGPKPTSTFPLTDKTVTVPNLVGKNAYEALTALGKLKLNAVVTFSRSAPGPNGLVASQQPAPGSSVREGSKAQLVVS